MENDSNAQELAALAEAEKKTNIIREFWGFLLHNKKWWLLPILLFLLLLGGLVMLSGSAVAPFIYTLF